MIAMMTLEQLRIFIEVAEREHLTRAAEALHLTPSAVSSAIRILEDHHSVTLFHRVGRRIELSSEGRLFLDEARVTLAQAQNAERLLIELGSGNRGTLAIHASQTSASYWLPKILARYHALYPAIDVSLTIGNTEQVAAATQSGQADVGFIEGAIDTSLFATQKVANDQLIILARPGHELDGLTSLSWPQLLACHWILREPGSGTRSVFEEAMRAGGVHPEQLQIALELPSNEAICTAVQGGNYLTAISQMVAGSHLAAGSLTRLDFQLPERQFTMITHRERYVSKALQKLQALLASAAP